MLAGRFFRILLNFFLHVCIVIHAQLFALLFATMSMPCIATFTVPTKVEDNCSYSASFMQQVIGREKEESKFDAFQYYSSDLLRLKALLLSPSEDDDELNGLAAVNDALRSAGLSNLTTKHDSKDKDASKRRRGNNSQSIEQKQKESGTPRKTRLSWELHPNLIFHELWDQIGEDIQSVSDDENGHEEQRAQVTPLIKD